MSMTEICEICVPSKRFLSVNALRDHQRHKFHMQGHRHCAKCGPVVAFNAFEQIDAHYKEYHNYENTLTCPGCTKDFDRVSKLIQHLELPIQKRCKVISVHDFENARLSQLHQIVEFFARAIAKLADSGACPVIKDRKIYADKIGLGIQGIPLPNNVLGLQPHELPEDLRERALIMFAAMNPDHPGFRAMQCYKPHLSGYLCPHDGCRKSFPNEEKLICHLRSLDHRGRVFCCHHCKHVFHSASDLMFHCEDQNRQCLSSKSPEHNSFIWQLTGGIITVDGKFPDGTLKYAVVHDALGRLKSRDVIVWDVNLGAGEQSQTVLDRVEKMATIEAAYRIFGIVKPVKTSIAELTATNDSGHDDSESTLFSEDDSSVFEVNEPKAHVPGDSVPKAVESKPDPFAEAAAWAKAARESLVALKQPVVRKKNMKQMFEPSINVCPRDENVKPTREPLAPLKQQLVRQETTELATDSGTKVWAGGQNGKFDWWW